MRSRIALGVILLVCAAATIKLYGEKPDRPVVEWSGSTMGTTWSVKLASEPLSEARQGVLVETIESALARVDQLMSTWKVDSELSRFNAHEAAAAFPISVETAQVFDVALAVARRSDGAFDVTIGPVVDAWGFGSRAPSEPPSDTRLAQLLQRVGFEQLELDLSGRKLRKSNPDLRCDLSAVAKGFAVDEVARALRGLGEQSFLVEVGGELRAAGRHRDGRSWRVAIESPNAAPQGGALRGIHRVVALDDLAMATSGDYRNFYVNRGKRLSHTIDPRTGRPITHDLASVTVLHREAVWADAWATALNVLGPEEGYALALEEGLAAYFILRSPESGTEDPDDDLEVRFTPNFESKLVEDPRSR